MNHLEYDWKSPIWRHLANELSRDYTLVRYDQRGNGLSDWTVESFSFAAFMSDLEAVVDAAQLERFSLFGISQGCAVAIEYAVRHPERVRKLVLLGGYARGWRRRQSPEEIAARDAMLTLIRTGWGQDNPAFRQLFSSLFMPEASAEEFRLFNELQRVSCSPENAARISIAAGEIDVSQRLALVSTPTLVLHCTEDARIPFAAGRALATGIPGARFVALESKNHLLLSHEPAWHRCLGEVRAFLAED
jgi:pimeloyl-ACP methyl ester carboxylesterase